MKSKSKSLSLADTQKLLGAEAPVPIGHLPTDPIGMKAIPALVRERLTSTGGRPSDPAWTVVKKVPMRMETWHALDRLAKQFQRTENVRVSAGQIAAYALERGLLVATSIQSTNTVDSPRRAPAIDDRQIPDHVRQVTHKAFAIVSERGVW